MTSVTRPRTVLWPVLTMACGAAMALGTFLPWATLRSAFGERATLQGTSSRDGWLALVCGLAIATTGAASLPRPRRLATVLADVVAVAGVVLAVYELVHVGSMHGVLGSANAEGTWDVTYGSGLTTVVLAAVVGLISAAGITGRDARSLIRLDSPQP